MRGSAGRILAAAVLAGAGLVAGADRAGAQETLDVTVSPTTGLEDGDSVTVSFTGPSNWWFVTQCDAAVGPDPDPSALFRLCGRQQDLGTVTPPVEITYTVARTFTSIDGETIRCGDAENDCLVTVAGPGGQPFAGVPVDMRPGPPVPLQVTASPSDGLLTNAIVDVEVTGTREEPIRVALCEASVVESRDLEPGPCTGYRSVPAGGRPAGTRVTVSRDFTGSDGASVHCGTAPGACVIAAGPGTGGEGTPFASTPVSFAAPREVTLSPSTGLLDGQAVDVAASNLTPGAAYRLVRCYRPELGANACEDRTDAPLVTAAADGTAHGTARAAQRLTTRGTPSYCRSGCAVGLVLDATGFLEGFAPYTLATGTLSVTPADGLADGQTVSVAGADLMPSYEGPPVGPFPTGGWALVHCDRAVTADPSLLGVFTHCGIPPGGGTVAVPGSELAAEVALAAAPERLLGGTADCTAAPDACVVALVRFEQDSSLTLVAAPVSFAPG